MAEKENCVRITRAAAAKKRAAESDHPAALAIKKRVVLGELPNLSNANAAPKPSLRGPKPLSKKSNPSRPKKTKPQQVGEKPSVGDTESGVDDPLLCANDASDIYQYLRSMEVKPTRRPLANFVETVQGDVTASMRAVLVDWLVEVAEEYKLISDTLYLTISYLDRFLSSHSLQRQKLQLLGVSCMLIASKYEEISPPHVEDFCYITDNTYTKEEVVKMESDILKLLNFEMGDPTIKTFLSHSFIPCRRFMGADQDDCKALNLQLEFLGSYLAELSLLDYGCVRFLPSMVAASAVFVARFTTNPKIHPWTTSLEQYSGYRSSELKDCVHAIHDLQLSRKWSTLAAIRDKYKQHKFKCVGALISPSEIPISYFDDLKGKVLIDIN